ncbi:MAG: hypothetical protein ACOYOE_00445 [Chlorobium sp.]
MTLTNNRNIIELSPAFIDRNASQKHIIISNDDTDDTKLLPEGLEFRNCLTANIEQLARKLDITVLELNEHH